MKRPPAYWCKAKKILSKRDPIIRKIIKKYKKGFLTTRSNPFFSLCRTIVGQQISTKAADSIWSKFEKKCKKRIIPNTVLKLSSRTLKGVGLSRQKVSYLKNIAKNFRNKSFNVSEIKKMNDEEAINYVTKIRGLGVWSAEMFLMFNFQLKILVYCEQFPKIIKHLTLQARNFWIKFLNCTLDIELYLLGICGGQLIQLMLNIKGLYYLILLNED